MLALSGNLPRFWARERAMIHELDTLFGDQTSDRTENVGGIMHDQRRESFALPWLTECYRVQ